MNDRSLRKAYWQKANNIWLDVRDDNGQEMFGVGLAASSNLRTVDWQLTRETFKALLQRDVWDKGVARILLAVKVDGKRHFQSPCTQADWSERADEVVRMMVDNARVYLEAIEEGLN